MLLIAPFLATEVGGFARLRPDGTLAVCTSSDDAEFAPRAADADVLVSTLRRFGAVAQAIASAAA